MGQVKKMMRAGEQAPTICSDKAVVASTRGARPATTYFGNCGYSFFYWTYTGRGTLGEWYGFNLNTLVFGATGVNSWTNVSTGAHNAYTWDTGPHTSGNYGSWRFPNTGRGWIYGVMQATAATLQGVCYTPYGQPYDVKYAY